MNVKKKRPVHKASKRTTRRNSTKTKADKKRRALKALERLKGIGEGIWNEDAQAYVNRLRGND